MAIAIEEEKASIRRCNIKERGGSYRVTKHTIEVDQVRA
jgi:hypothetical protein